MHCWSVFRCLLSTVLWHTSLALQSKKEHTNPVRPSRDPIPSQVPLLSGRSRWFYYAGSREGAGAGPGVNGHHTVGRGSVSSLSDGLARRWSMPSTDPMGGAPKGDRESGGFALWSRSDDVSDVSLTLYIVLFLYRVRPVARRYLPVCRHPTTFTWRVPCGDAVADCCGASWALGCSALSGCMGGRGTLFAIEVSSRAGRASAMTCVHSAGRGTRSAGTVWCQQLGLLLSLYCTLWCMVLLHLSRLCLRTVVSSHRPQYSRAALGLHRAAWRRARRSQGANCSAVGACEKNWILHNARGHGLLICNLKRASAKPERSSGGTSHRPQRPTVLSTLISHAPLDVLM